MGNRGWGERLEHLVGLDAAKVAIGLLLTAPYIPMLFMGEEWATSSPFLYFADHEDEEMRRSVAEGRKREFAAFGFDGDVPNPEDQKTYETVQVELGGAGRRQARGDARLGEGTDQTPPQQRRLNDGDMHHLVVSTDDEQRTLVMERDEARVLINFGKCLTHSLCCKGETLELISRDGLDVRDNHLRSRR